MARTAVGTAKRPAAGTADKTGHRTAHKPGSQTGSKTGSKTAGSTAARHGSRNEATVGALLERHGQTYAEQAGIMLRNTPVPLYRLLVLSHLLSARIRADIAVASARALSDDGMRDARRMADATWQQRVDALGKGGYRRYDERTATQLGDGAQLLLEKYNGDLRRLREDSAPGALLREIPGIGPTGTDIFLREVQQVWPEFGPCFDQKAQQGAERLGLPRSARRLAEFVPRDDRARLAAALVRAALDQKVVEDVRKHRY